VVGRRRETTALFDGYAEAQISSLQAVISRLPSQTSSDYESCVAYVYEQCLKAERLTANSWRVAAQSEGSDAARLAGHLETLEMTRQSLVVQLEGRSLSAQLDMACVRSPLSDHMIAEMLDTTAEQLWRWRNQEAIPGEAVELVQAFIATSKDRDSDDEPG
jgi:lambda repressor-like predicted transcriptional regulator